MNIAIHATHPGSCYFFFTTEARDAFEASHQGLDGDVAMPPVGETQERRFKASGATTGRAGQSSFRSSAPDASFLG